MRKPTSAEILGALNTMLHEYCEIDSMLDSFMSTSEPSLTERQQQRESNKIRDRMQKLYDRAISQ